MHPLPPGYTAVQPDVDQDWFDALDERFVAVGARRLRLLVQGVVPEPQGTWIQLAAADDPLLMLLLHVRQGARVDDVLAALGRVDVADDRPPVIEVAQAA